MAWPTWCTTLAAACSAWGGSPLRQTRVVRERSPRRSGSLRAPVDRDASKSSTCAKTTARRWLGLRCKSCSQRRRRLGGRCRNRSHQTPVTGATVGGSVEVRGWISTVPFENNLTYRVYSEGGAAIGRGWITVEGDLGERGTFAKSITLPSTQASGPVRIEIRLPAWSLPRARFETSTKPMARCSPAPRSRCFSPAAALR